MKKLFPAILDAFWEHSLLCGWHLRQNMQVIVMQGVI